MEPRALQFAYRALGKPSVPTMYVRFNLSHAGDLAPFAFARDCELRVDVERERHVPEAENIVERFFSALGCVDLAPPCAARPSGRLLLDAQGRGRRLSKQRARAVVGTRHI